MQQQQRQQSSSGSSGSAAALEQSSYIDDDPPGIDAEPWCGPFLSAFDLPPFLSTRKYACAKASKGTCTRARDWAIEYFIFDMASRGAMSVAGSKLVQSSKGKVMKRAARGIYEDKQVMYGNNVSHSRRRYVHAWAWSCAHLATHIPRARRTRRRWLPNAQWKRLYSETLDAMLRFRITTHALRTIDKHGGIDNYLLRTPDDRLPQKAVDAKLRIQRAREQIGGVGARVA